MRRRSLVGLAAVVAAGALFAGACGGDDDDADGSRREDAPEDAARPDSDTADATTTTTAGGASDEGAAGSSADDDVGEIGEMDFCDGFRAAIRLDSTTALAGARQLEPPAEIVDDWQVFLDFAESSLSNEPPPADVEAAGAAAEEATSHVLDYVGQECGYSVDTFTGEVTENDDG
jgi:hypothetical protein